MRDELEAIFGRKVDILTRAGVENSHNWIRRQEILGTAETYYAA
jgi:predicted nucleotidyltransferase